MTYEEYEQEAKRRLTEKRFAHSQCVAACGAALAEKYGADPEKARLAGILHDIMKDTGEEEQLKIMEQFGIMLSQAQRHNPKLWHALSGAAYLGGADTGVQAALTGLGFTGVQAYNYHPSAEKAGRAAAYVFARKKLPDSTWLTAVVIRGTGEYMEWAGNLNMGSGPDHSGFARAGRSSASLPRPLAPRMPHSLP